MLDQMIGLKRIDFLPYTYSSTPRSYQLFVATDTWKEVEASLREAGGEGAEEIMYN